MIFLPATWPVIFSQVIPGLKVFRLHTRIAQGSSYSCHALFMFLMRVRLGGGTRISDIAR